MHNFARFKREFIAFLLISLFLLMDGHPVNCTADVIFTNTFRGIMGGVRE